MKKQLTKINCLSKLLLCSLLALINMSFEKRPNFAPSLLKQVKVDTPKKNAVHIDIDLKDLNKALNEVNIELKGINLDKIAKDIQISLESIDMDKVKNEVAQSLNTIDWAKIKSEVNTSLKDINIDEIKINIRKAADQIKINIDSEKIKKSRRNLKMNTTKPKVELLKNIDKIKRDTRNETTGAIEINKFTELPPARFTKKDGFFFLI